MSIFDILNGGLMGGAATPGIDGASPAQGIGGLMMDPKKMMLLQMGANMLQASQGQPGQGRPGLGGILGSGAQGALQGIQNAQQMQMQQAHLGAFQEKLKIAKDRERRYEEFVKSPDFAQLPPPVRQAIESGGPEMLDQFYKGQVEQATQGPPDAVRQYQYAQQDPAFADYQMQLKRAGAANTTVKLPTLENEYDKAMGKANAETYIDLNKQGAEAGNTIAKYQQLGTLLSQPGVYQGAGGETVLQAKKIGTALGMDLSGVSDAEAGQAISRSLALELRNPASGAGMPGAMSDQDREYLKSLVAGVGNTPEGNARLIEAKIKVEQRKREVAKLARQFTAQSGGRFDQAKFFDYLQKWSDTNPLFDTGGAGGWNIKREE
jgi:acyl-CoA-binding protein